jgi:RNA polymerase sigma-70 factor, ECF subfamily
MEDLHRLALAARDGDRVALAAFVRAAQPDVWRYVAHLASAAEADDLTQETLLRVLRALPSFRSESSARTWLLAIARRTVADHVRKAQRRRRLRPPRPDPVPSTDGLVDLHLLLHALPPDRRDAFVLTQVLGLPYAEAAAVCACPVGTIRSRVARARDELIAAGAHHATG